jgi:hypothetical protein
MITNPILSHLIARIYECKLEKPILTFHSNDVREYLLIN